MANKYVRTEEYVEYVILEKPESLTESEVRGCFPEGGVVLYRPSGSKMKVLVHIRPFEDFDNEELINMVCCRKDIKKLGEYSTYAFGPCTQLIRDINNWLKRTTLKEFTKDISSKVIGQPGLNKLLTNIYLYMKNLAAGRANCSLSLIAAPSGCGKTETYRALCEYFKVHIPRFVVAQIDMCDITENGFKGNDAEIIVSPVSKTNGVGIIFLDEFDKKLIPSFTQGGTDANKAVQAQMLTLLEGRVMPTKKGNVDTRNTLFIGTGSFDVCRKVKREVPRTIGFENEDVSATANHYDDITREDMLELGASYELLGRFSMIINYHELNDEAIEKVIDRLVEEVSDNLGCKIKLTSRFRENIHNNANTKYGCRNMRNIIFEKALAAYEELELAGKYKRGCTLKLDLFEDEVCAAERDES